MDGKKVTIHGMKKGQIANNNKFDRNLEIKIGKKPHFQSKIRSQNNKSKSPVPEANQSKSRTKKFDKINDLDNKPLTVMPAPLKILRKTLQV